MLGGYIGAAAGNHAVGDFTGPRFLRDRPVSFDVAVVTVRVIGRDPVGER